MVRRIVSVVVLVVALVAGWSVGSPAYADPGSAVSWNIATDGDEAYLSDAALNARLDDVAASGAQWVRLRYDLNNIEKTQGAFTTDDFDRLTMAANSRGLKVLGILYGTPEWAVESSCTTYNWQCQPRPAAYAAMASYVAAHWNGTVAGAGKVYAWEHWNEPNCFDALAHRDINGYAQMVIQAAPQIRAQTTATIVLGAPAPCATGPDGWSPRDWLAQLYARGLRGTVDAIGQHPYCFAFDSTEPCPQRDFAWNAWRAMYQDYPADNGTSNEGRSIRHIMADNGDSALPIWITEYGTPTRCEANLSEAVQRDNLVAAAQALSARPAQEPWGPVFVFQARDRSADCTVLDENNVPKQSTEAAFGLLNFDRTPKLAWPTFRNLALAAPVAVEGTTTMPNLTWSGTGVNEPVKVTFTTTTSGNPHRVDELIVAIRDPNGANVDMPVAQGGVSLVGTQVWSESSTFTRAGTYTFWVAWSEDGTWHDETAKTMVLR